MSSALPDARRLDYHYIAMQTGFWAMFAAVCAYQAALLTARGFTNRWPTKHKPLSIPGILPRFPSNSRRRLPNFAM